MSDRERLVKLLDDAYKSVTSSVHSHRVADVLLAAGVTLPPAPEPPKLVTEEMAEKFKSGWERHHSPPVWYGRYYQLDALNALVAAAIRRAVERKTDTECADFVDALQRCNYNTKRIGAAILALFGLDGGAS